MNLRSPEQLRLWLTHQSSRLYTQHSRESTNQPVAQLTPLVSYELGIILSRTDIHVVRKLWNMARRCSIRNKKKKLLTVPVSVTKQTSTLVCGCVKVLHSKSEIKDCPAEQVCHALPDQGTNCLCRTLR